MKGTDVMVRARDILQDVAGVRYLDADLMRYITDAQRRARALRPDLFIGALSTPLAEVTDPNETLSVPDQFLEAFAFYVAGRAEIRDDEYAVDGRAAQLLGALTQKLVQGV